jgi:hypothetical protein
MFNNNMFKPLTLGRWPTLSLRVERGLLRQQFPQPLAIDLAALFVGLDAEFFLGAL